jgi:hypothetical protein
MISGKNSFVKSNLQLNSRIHFFQADSASKRFSTGRARSPVSLQASEPPRVAGHGLENGERLF